MDQHPGEQKEFKENKPIKIDNIACLFNLYSDDMAQRKQWGIDLDFNWSFGGMKLTEFESLYHKN